MQVNNTNKKSEYMNEQPKIKKARLRYTFTDKIETVLLNVVKNHPDWSIPQIRDEVNKICKNKCPGLRAFQNKIPEFKKYLNNNALDRPWNSSSLGHYPVFFEVLPILFRIKSIKKNKLLVRDARWINRLYPVMKNQCPKGVSEEKLIAGLWFLASMYSLQEAVFSYQNENSSEAFDASRLDESLLELIKYRQFFTGMELGPDEPLKPGDLKDIAKRFGAQIVEE